MLPSFKNKNNIIIKENNSLLSYNLRDFLLPGFQYFELAIREGLIIS